MCKDEKSSAESTACPSCGRTDRHGHRVMAPALAPERPLYPDQPGYASKETPRKRLSLAQQKMMAAIMANGGECKVSPPYDCWTVGDRTFSRRTGDALADKGYIAHYHSPYEGHSDLYMVQE